MSDAEAFASAFAIYIAAGIIFFAYLHWKKPKYIEEFGVNIIAIGIIIGIFIWPLFIGSLDKDDTK